jgi:fructan beta-fructosidase
MKRSIPLLVLIFVSGVLAAGRPDVLIADFESDTYGDGWKTTSTAFGKGKAEPSARTFAVDKTYLHLPIKNGAAMKRVRFVVDNKTVREFDAELADGATPDFWAFADVSAFKGKMLLVETALFPGSKALEALALADDMPSAEKLYREKYRPLFHFTSRFGWLNDPNGLVFLPSEKKETPLFDPSRGEWHLFYQHNPFGVKWGNMHWGHAVSEDLVRWKELGIGLYPKKYGDWAFSGSAVYDKDNTSGWGTTEKPPLVLAYTSTGRGECIAFSSDRGQTWKEYDKNPVVKHTGRDPKLIWHQKAKLWVMAVYDESQGKRWIAFYNSPDLKNWTYASRIEGFYECPDLFELPLDNDAMYGTKWVLYAADGKYLTGDFDGKAFKPDSKVKKQLWYGRFYAAQTFDNAPMQPLFLGSGAVPPRRPWRIQIGWAKGVTFPGMPFNQQMTVPVALSLFTPNDGPRLAALPFGVASLHDKKAALEFRWVGDDARGWDADRPDDKRSKVLADDLDAFDLWTEIKPRKATKITFDLRGTKLVYDVTKQTLTCKDVSAPVKMTSPWNDGLPKHLVLRILVDRGSVEVFADSGLVAMSVAALPEEKNRKVELHVEGDAVGILQMSIHRIQSAWKK